MERDGEESTLSEVRETVVGCRGKFRVKKFTTAKLYFFLRPTSTDPRPPLFYQIHKLGAGFGALAEGTEHCGRDDG